MKKIFIIILLISSYALNAQQIEFVYDAHGNRVVRQVVTEKIDTTDFSETDSSVFIANTVKTNENTKLQIINTQNNTHINIYPNPTRDILNINIITENTTLENKIYVFSENGQLLQQHLSCKQINRIDLSNFSLGTYIIIIDTGYYKYKQKIIKN